MGDGYPSDWESRRRKVYQRDGYKCQKCGDRGGSMGGAELHAHHKTPISQGGSHEMSNLVTLCRDCHNMEHSHPVGGGASSIGAGDVVIAGVIGGAVVFMIFIFVALLSQAFPNTINSVHDLPPLMGILGALGISTYIGDRVYTALWADSADSPHDRAMTMSFFLCTVLSLLFIVVVFNSSMKTKSKALCSLILAVMAYVSLQIGKYHDEENGHPQL